MPGRPRKGAPTSLHILVALRHARRAAVGSPAPSCNAPVASAARACSAGIPKASAMASSSSARPTASSPAPLAKRMSIAAGSTRDRFTGSWASASRRRMALTEAVVRPRASHSRARPRLWFMTEGCGVGVRPLGAGDVAEDATNVAALGVGESGGLAGAGRGVTPHGEVELLARLGEGAAQTHDLAAVHRALAGEGDQSGLRVAPPGERRRPLGGAPEVGDSPDTPRSSSNTPARRRSARPRPRRYRPWPRRTPSARQEPGRRRGASVPVPSVRRRRGRRRGSGARSR